MLSRYARWSLGLLAAVGMAGCATVSGMMGTVIPITHPQVQYALKNNDADTLKKICSGEWKVDVFNDKDAACDYVRKTETQAAVAAAASAPCDQLSASYAKLAKTRQEDITVFGKAFAKCGMYKELFENVAHWGNNNEGARILKDVEAAGFPVEQEFVKYAKANPGVKFLPIDSPDYGLRHINLFLIQKGSLQHCPVYAAAAKGAKEEVKVWMLPYFREAKCKEGLPIAHEILLSSSPKYRIWACDALADFGDTASLKKVSTLASTDGYSEVREQQGNDGRVWGMKVFPVQDACKEAAGKIKLRLD